MGFVFQYYNLMPVLTAVENVELPLLVARVAPPRPAGARSRRSSWSGCPTARGHVPDELSGGERQRVTIARALVNEPAIVWADEPTGDLDSANAEEITALLRRLNVERGLTLLIVTHDLAVGSATDRIIRMVDGRSSTTACSRWRDAAALRLPVALADRPRGRAGRRRSAWSRCSRCAIGSCCGSACATSLRRRGRAALIVTGLMLGTTIICSALVTGDTMSRTVRGVGDRDARTHRRARRRPRRRGDQPEFFPRIASRRRPRAARDRCRRRHGAGDRAPVAVQDTRSRQTEARVSLFAPDPARLRGFGDLDLSALAPGEVYLDRDAAEELSPVPAIAS